MATEAIQVTSFQGLAAGSRRPLASDRRPFDTPRDIVNMVVDDYGHLWMPKAYDGTDSTVPGAGDIVQILWTVVGGTFCQRGTKVYASSRAPGRITDPEQWIELADVGGTDPVWVVNHGYSDPDLSTYVYFGNGSGTWKYQITGDDSASVTNLTSTLDGFHGWVSTMYLGRRFVAGAGDGQSNQRLYYSGIDQPESFTEDDYLNIGGSSTGKDSSTFPGEITGLLFFENNLAIMCAGSIWVLSGASIESFHLRRIQGDIGSQGRTDLHYHAVPDGTMFFGGERAGELGVYLFTGGYARKVSGEIDRFFNEWQLEYDTLPATGDQAAYVRVRAEIGRWANAVRYRGHYILSFDPAQDDRQVYLYNLNTRAWSTFDGWSPGPALLVQHDYYSPQRLLIGKAGTIYESTETFPRWPGRPAKFTLGWHDDGQPSGFVRFLGVKLTGWKSGTGTPTAKLTARVPGGSVTETLDLTDDVFENLVFPINLRGNAVELAFEIQPTSDDQQVVIESAQLIHSRKGEKLSRT